MKQKLIVILSSLFLLAVFNSCRHRGHHNTSISISESEREFQLNASYEKKKTHRLQRYLSEELLENETPLNKNTHLNAVITLYDKTRFYMQCNPGELEIKFNKTDNSGESYLKMKEICEDIKELLAKN